MENKQMKCVKGESCLYCGSTYCRFVDELDQLKSENEHLSEKEEEAKHYLEEAEKFKNCLTEIKEIAEKGYESSQITKLILDLILQKINEVENETTK